MKKKYHFTYQEAISALEKLHPGLIPEWKPPHKRDHTYEEVEFEIEPKIENIKQRSMKIEGPITTIIEPRQTYHDDGHPF